jgi:hypothetical protein
MRPSHGDVVPTRSRWAKEAMPRVKQLVEVKRRPGERLSILCCDFPSYSIVLPTLAIYGNGTANIGGNIIPEEMARMSRPWDSFDKAEEARALYYHWYPLLEALSLVLESHCHQGGTADPRPAGRRDPPSLSRAGGREARQAEGDGGRNRCGGEVRPQEFRLFP